MSPNVPGYMRAGASRGRGKGCASVVFFLRAEIRAAVVLFAQPKIGALRGRRLAWLICIPVHYAPTVAMLDHDESGQTRALV